MSMLDYGALYGRLFGAGNRNSTPSSPDGSEPGSRRTRAAEPWWTRFLNEFGNTFRSPTATDLQSRFGFHTAQPPFEEFLAKFDPRYRREQAAFAQSTPMDQEAQYSLQYGSPLPLASFQPSPTTSTGSLADAATSTKNALDLQGQQLANDFMSSKLTSEKLAQKLQQQALDLNQKNFDYQAQAADAKRKVEMAIAQGNWAEAAAQRQLQREAMLASNQLALQQLALDRQQFSLKAQTETMGMIRDIISDPLTLAAFQRLGLALPGMDVAAPAQENFSGMIRNAEAPQAPATRDYAYGQGPVVFRSGAGIPSGMSLRTPDVPAGNVTETTPEGLPISAEFGGPVMNLGQPLTAQEAALLAAGPSEELQQGGQVWIPGRGWEWKPGFNMYGQPEGKPQGRGHWEYSETDGLHWVTTEETQAKAALNAPLPSLDKDAFNKARQAPTQNNATNLAAQFNEALTKARATSKQQAPLSPQAQAVMSNPQLNAYIIEAALAGQNPKDLIAQAQRSAPRRGPLVARG